MRNLNQELEEQIKKLKEDKKSQDDRFEKIKSNNNRLENKVAQIQKEASILSGKQIQVEEEEIKRLNKIIMDKYNELTHGHRNILSQESGICRHQKHMKELWQMYDEIKKARQLENKKLSDNLASNTEELFRLRIHNKTLLTKIKKLKNSRKMELSNEDLEGRILKEKKKTII